MLVGAVKRYGSGQSAVDDRELTMLRRERIGFVFQAFNLVGTLTAEENICLPLTSSVSQPRWT